MIVINSKNLLKKFSKCFRKSLEVLKKSQNFLIKFLKFFKKKFEIVPKNS